MIFLPMSQSVLDTHKKALRDQLKGLKTELESEKEKSKAFQQRAETITRDRCSNLDWIGV